MDLSGFMRYWSLTLAVFVFYAFAILVASLDVIGEMSEAARKKRAAVKASPLDPNPLAGRTVAGALLPGPGQQPDARGAWVVGLVEGLVRRLTPVPTVKMIVLEDSKGHLLVHFSDGARLATYRLDRSLVDAAMGGEAARLDEVTGLLSRHLMADFLGHEEARPPRTTELAREQAGKASAGQPDKPPAS